MKFKYFGCVLDESGTDGEECNRKVASGKGLQMPLRPELMLGICSMIVLGSCMKHFFYLFLCMAVRQYYGGRRRNLELGLYRRTTSEDC